MADANKSEKARKHAAARKKVKEYQQRQQLKKKSENEESSTCGDSLTNSAHSSINENFIAFEHQNVEPQETFNSPLHNYFSNDLPAQPINFFDNLNSNENRANLQVIPSINFDNDSTAMDYPELKQNELYDFAHSKVEHPAVSTEDAEKLSNYLEKNDSESEKLASFFSSTEQPHNNAFVMEQSNGDTKQHHVDTISSQATSVESLKNLTSQITELIQDDFEIKPKMEPFQPSFFHEGNTEIRELEQVRLKNMEYESKIRSLENDNRQLKSDFEIRLNREVGPLQEQLQCHAQTVGILVGEKTELSHALSQSQLMTKLKSTECEELQGRLKTSRSRVADLEKELQNYKADKLRGGVHQQEIEKLKKEIQQSRLEKEEAMQDLTELKEKLNHKEADNLKLLEETKSLSHQLSLMQVKLQQITVSGTLEAESQLETLMQEKLASEKEVADLKNALKCTSEERDQSSVQYQQYVQQLNKQVATFASRMETLTEENEALAKREQNLVNHIGELEKLLQRNADEKITNKGTDNIKVELETITKSLHDVQTEKSSVEEKLREVLIDQQKLTQELHDRNESVQQLQSRIEMLEGLQPDSVKLLAVMESDKIAASRAVSQNAELKQQLEEMQNVFVKMSNDKLELTDQLATQQFKTRDLTEKLTHCESHLQTLTEAIDIKDKELTQVRENLSQVSKQVLQQDQLADRLRHYEAQEGGMQSLQIELHELRHQIQNLQEENSKLKETSNVNVTDGSERIVAPISPTESNEIDELKSRIKELEERNQELERRSKLHDLPLTVKEESNQNGDVNILDKESAMKHLEEKFTRTMNDIANLTEEKQRLEHLVLQLQVETETIGEYITLYQHQRGVLKQRTQEKDEQLKRLAQDREKVRVKLEMLNSLVKKLVQEKGVLSPDILEQHQQLSVHSEDLCDEHAKIHKEISKIAQENLSNDSDASPLENNNRNSQTAEQIMALLTEIKSSSLIQPSEGLENFHPCPWCSGQLITV